MIIVDPVALGDVACTRASPKWVCDRTGTLVQVPADTLAVTYDPSDLSKAPYAMVEAPSTNSIRNNTMSGAQTSATSGPWGLLPNNWQVDLSTAQRCEVVGVQVGGASSGIDFIDVRFYSAANDRGYVAIYPEPTNGTGVAGVVPGQVWAGSAYVKSVAGTLPPNNVVYVRAIGPASEVGSWGTFFKPADSNTPLRQGRVAVTTPPIPKNALPLSKKPSHLWKRTLKSRKSATSA